MKKIFNETFCRGQKVLNEKLDMDTKIDKRCCRVDFFSQYRNMNKLIELLKIDVSIKTYFESKTIDELLEFVSAVNIFIENLIYINIFDEDPTLNKDDCFNRIREISEKVKNYDRESLFIVLDYQKAFVTSIKDGLEIPKTPVIP